MKRFAFLALLLVCLVCPSRAQDAFVPILGGPLVYAAGYIDQTLPTDPFELNFILDVDPVASFATYAEGWALESEFVNHWTRVEVTHRYSLLSDATYSAVPVSLTEWEAAAWSGWTYLGSRGALRWVQTLPAQIDIDLGLGEGVNFTYLNTHGNDWVGSGSLTIAGTHWTVTGTVRSLTIDVRIGRLEFVPEPSSLAAVAVLTGLFVVRRKKA